MPITYTYLNGLLVTIMKLYVTGLFNNKIYNQYTNHKSNLFHLANINYKFYVKTFGKMTLRFVTFLHKNV